MQQISSCAATKLEIDWMAILPTWEGTIDRRFPFELNPRDNAELDHLHPAIQAHDADHLNPAIQTHDADADDADADDAEIAEETAFDISQSIEDANEKN